MTTRTRKPKIEYYWTPVYKTKVVPSTTGSGNMVRVPDGQDAYVNWRLIGANGETMCQSTQGFRDKTDARRAIDDVLTAIMGDDFHVGCVLAPKEVGPGRKPGTGAAK